MDNCFNRLFVVWTVHAFIVDTEGRLTHILQSHTKYDDEGAVTAVWPSIMIPETWRRHWRVAQ